MRPGMIGDLETVEAEMKNKQNVRKDTDAGKSEVDTNSGDESEHGGSSRSHSEDAASLYSSHEDHDSRSKTKQRAGTENKIDMLVKLVTRNTFLEEADAHPAKLKRNLSEPALGFSRLSVSNYDVSVSFSSRSSSTRDESTVDDDLAGNLDLLQQIEKASPAPKADGATDGENPPSIGSANHFQGTCSPCRFFRKGCCRGGESCLHCHFHHHVARRPGKSQRQREKDRRHRGALAASSSEVSAEPNMTPNIASTTQQAGHEGEDTSSHDSGCPVLMAPASSEEESP